MENFYTISTLHLVDSGEAIKEEDTVTVKTHDGCVFTRVHVVQINGDNICISLSEYDLEATIGYDYISDIKLEEIV